MNSQTTETSKVFSKRLKVPQKRTKSLGQPRKPSQTSNQKKSDSKKPNISKKRTDIYINDYMKRIIKEKGSKGNYYCNICIGKPELQKRSVYRHILESSAHHDQIPKDEEEEHNNLVSIIQKKIQKNKSKRSKKSGTNYEDTRCYLNFLGFCQKLNLSFNQISQLGKYLNELAKEDKLGFLEKFTFEREEVSNLARWFGHFLINELKKDLELSPFSLSIDNSTIAKKTICALKVRFLKKSLDENGIRRNYLQSKLIGIKYLKHSSNAEAVFNATKEKLLNLSEKVKENFVGYVHDHHSTLTGKKKGLGKLLQEELKTPFMDLKDPCHSLNLAVNKALKYVPEEMRNFVEDLHFHFISPQRVAFLLKIQKENNLKQLNLKYYVKTRWLSLGQSLERLLKIWDSLILYMKAKPSFIGLKNSTFNKFLVLLESKEFKIKMKVWTSILLRLNEFNERFQGQTLEIQNLKIGIHRCIWEIANLFIDPKYIPQNISLFKADDWKLQVNKEIEDGDKEEKGEEEDLEEKMKEEGDEDENSNVKDKFISVQGFIKKLIIDFDSNLSELQNFDDNLKEEVAKIFQSYLCNMFFSLLNYLPYKCELINALDFVNLTKPVQEIKDQVLFFNEKFSIVPLNQISNLSKEINQLMNHSNFVWLKSITKGSSLHFWDLIQTTCEEESFMLLPRLFEVAHALPTSSAGIEQSFSLVKLVRSNLRNNLKEETTQALLLIAQEFKEGYEVTDELISLYYEWKADKEYIDIKLEKHAQNNQEGILEDQVENNKSQHSSDEIDQVRRLKVRKVGGVKEEIFNPSNIETEEINSQERNNEITLKENNGKRKFQGYSDKNLKQVKTNDIFLGLDFYEEEQMIEYETDEDLEDFYECEEDTENENDIY